MRIPAGSTFDRIVVFEIGGRLCGVPSSVVREVVHMAELARPPGLPPLIEGLLDVGGDMAPVIRLGRLFDFPDVAVGLYTPVVLTQGEGSPMAFVVEAVRGVVAVNPQDLSPVGDRDSFNGCVTAEFRAGEDTVHLLSPERLLTAQERRRLAEYEAIGTERLAAMAEPPT